MTEALNDHPIVADTLMTRIELLSRDPASEVVIVVAHGPVADDANAKWLTDMSSIVNFMKTLRSYHRIDFMTVRDDAPEPIRSAATVELCAKVEQATRSGKRVIVAPLLIAYGGRARHPETPGRARVRMPMEGLLPDVRLAEWARTVASANASLQ
jgi:hypothetical protein